MAGLQADKDIIAGLAEATRDEAELYDKKKIESTTSHEHELDGIHDGLEFPTEEERLTLRRVSDTIPWSAYREFPLHPHRRLPPSPHFPRSRAHLHLPPSDRPL